jgi:hypothetical protein
MEYFSGNRDVKLHAEKAPDETSRSMVYYLKYLIFATAIITGLVFIYKYIEEKNIIQFYYYATQYQLYDVYKSKIAYYDILFNIAFVFIVIILSIVLYWDSVYKNAKRISNCNNIIKIIDENSVSKTPYIYSVIIINSDKIALSSHNFLIRITYNFNTKNTKFEYGTDKGTDNKIFNVMGHKYDEVLKTVSGMQKSIDESNNGGANPDESHHIRIYINQKNTINDLNDKPDSIDNNNLESELMKIFNDSDSIKNQIFRFLKLYDNDKAIRSNDIFNKYENLIYENPDDIEKIKGYIRNIYNELIELSGISQYQSDKIAKINLIKGSDLYKKAEIYNKTKNSYKNFNYFDLRTMSNIPDSSINMAAINSNKYKYLCTDKNGNIIKTYTANKLVEFTKEFSNNTSYNTTIINNILFANKNKDKISL